MRLMSGIGSLHAGGRSSSGGGMNVSRPAASPE